MKFLVVLSLVALAAADVSHLEAAAPILRSSSDISPDGQFQYSYETGNGISAQSDGSLKTAGAEYPYLVHTGAFKYTSPDGTPVELQYTADENGFQPQGSHLPVPPPIPELIARSLAYIAAHPPAVEPQYKAAAKAPTPFNAFG